MQYTYYPIENISSISIMQFNNTVYIFFDKESPGLEMLANFVAHAYKETAKYAEEMKLSPMRRNVTIFLYSDETNVFNQNWNGFILGVYPDESYFILLNQNLPNKILGTTFHELIHVWQIETINQDNSFNATSYQEIFSSRENFDDFDRTTSWFVEATANLWKYQKFPDPEQALLDKLSIAKNPGTSLWNSPGPPLLYAYKLYTFFNYLVDKGATSIDHIWGAFKSTLLPQQYLYNTISNFSRLFNDWAINTTQLFINHHGEFKQVIQFSGTSLKYSPQSIYYLENDDKEVSLSTHGWSYNSIKLLTDTYAGNLTINFEGDKSNDPSQHFSVFILTQNDDGQYDIIPMQMNPTYAGNIIIQALPQKEWVLVICSTPYLTLDTPRTSFNAPYNYTLFLDAVMR